MASAPQEPMYQVPAKRRITSMLFGLVSGICVLLGIALLVIVLWGAVRDGLGRVNFGFVKGLLSTNPAKTGAWNAVVGSLYIVGITVLVSVPTGIAAAILLEELTGKSKLKDLIQANVANLAGVPSIIYGILGLAVFSRGMNLGSSILAGALTMSLLVLPTVILVTQEALRMVPKPLRDGSLALGASKWQTLFKQVLPFATPTILTGVILSASRAIGETSPLFVIGAVAYSRRVPDSLDDNFTVLPIQIYNWSSMPEKGFAEVASAGIIVLIAALLTLNVIAIILRNRTKRA